MFLRYNLYTILWAVLIMVLVLMPGEYMPKIKTDSLISVDKLAHAFVFCVLVMLMIVGFIKQYTYSALRNNAVKYTLFISISFAILLEITQALSPGRTLELYDGVANITGCLIGYGLFYIIYKF